jgi:Uma2 family endonuclease
MIAAVSTPARRTAPADAATLLGDRRENLEVIGGELVEKAAPSADHGFAQAELATHLCSQFQRRGGGRPGGWWIMTEVLIELEPHELYQPDLSGWRRERSPDRPRGTPVRLRPDWVCEILSPSNASDDLVAKLRVYHRCQVPHYWILDPERETLTVHRWSAEGYVVALTARRGERVSAEPFAAAPLEIGVLFGDEPTTPSIT